MGDGAEMTLGTLTGVGFGRDGAEAAVVVGAGVDAGAAACTGVDAFATGAGVESFFGGDTAGECEGLDGSTGVSCLIAAGCGAGDALREGGTDIGAGEACLAGGEKVGCALDSAEGGGEDALADALDLPNLSDSLGFGCAMGFGGATFDGKRGAVEG